MSSIILFILAFLAFMALGRAITWSHVKRGNLVWFEDQYGVKVLMSPEGET